METTSSQRIKQEFYLPTDSMGGEPTRMMLLTIHCVQRALHTFSRLTPTVTLCSRQ